MLGPPTSMAKSQFKPESPQPQILVETHDTGVGRQMLAVKHLPNHVSTENFVEAPRCKSAEWWAAAFLTWVALHMRREEDAHPVGT